MTIDPEDILNKEIMQWGFNYLSSHGYHLKHDQVEKVQDTPWSYVIRFSTSNGYIYLKHTPQLLGLEPDITQILHDHFHASVPKIIAHNSKLNCFLMKDAGIALRGILKKQFDVALLCKAIDQFSSMQLAVADQINIFIDLGVPDWRLDKLPELFEHLLSQKDILKADDVSEIEITQLEALIPTISRLCQKLAGFLIQPTIVQCDFHDNNLLLDETTQKIAMIDLGEVVISHPFFSIAGFLRQIKRHHGVKDETISELLDAYLKNYAAFESKNNLLEAFEIARILWFAYEALAQYRLMLACDKARFLSFQRHGKLRDSLREFLNEIAPLTTSRDLSAGSKGT
jgi:hypothetical protein